MRGGRYLVVLAGAESAAPVTRTAGQSARVAVTTTMQTPGMPVSFTETGAFDFARSAAWSARSTRWGSRRFSYRRRRTSRFPVAWAGHCRAGKSWIAVDAGISGGPVSSLLGPFGGGADPADLLASLTAISSGVTQLDSTTIRGVPVSRFPVDIDPAKAAARVPRWERPGFLEFMTALGSGAIPVDVWVDGQNLVRRVKLSLHLPGGAGAPAGARLVQSTDFYDFGRSGASLGSARRRRSSSRSG
jgi:hypothetical protein